MGKSQKQRLAESIQREELADELQRIIKRAKRIKENKKELQYNYMRWCNINEMTITSLTELRDKIVNANAVANTVATAASITEIIGGVLSIAGAIADKSDLVETGNKITRGGNVANIGTFAIKNAYLKDLCNEVTGNFRKNKQCSDIFESNRYTYFQELEGFKRELRTAETNNTLPLLLETAQREKIDFLGDLGLDDATKSKLRTNLRKMCRTNSKKIKATSENIRTQEVCKVFASQIRGLLYEFKELIYDDDSLFSIFSQETKNFLGENIDELLPYLDTAESWLGQYSGMDLLRGGTAVYDTFSAVMPSSASRTEIGVMSGVRMASSFADLMMRINDIDRGSKSKESEELTERIEEMKETRKKIIKAMRENFGWKEPLSARSIDFPKSSSDSYKTFPRQ